PTTLRADELGALITAFTALFDLQPGAEVTCEANPDTVDVAYLEALRAGGVERLSIGVQSFDRAVLEALDRVHPASSARRAFAAARRAGFTNVSVDLIYGARGETLPSWVRTLDEAIALRPEHLSCYALTVEPNTRLGRSVATGTLVPPEPDLQADMYEAACERLAAAGYRHYEVSNWAFPGFESRHNLGYWEGRAYLGLGAGAHSFRSDRRWWNVRPPERYLALVEDGRPPLGGGERLTEQEARLEHLLLALRRADGLPVEEVPPDVAASFAERGLSVLEGDRFLPTEPGMLLANEMVLALSP
ncbi:MAG TPA: radical SAM family heme chaperone HemW, partial [Actinomycetota bacterium]|nr:radical SAM family heme chaperone HemW [Actinomycetota bacterium]